MIAPFPDQETTICTAVTTTVTISSPSDNQGIIKIINRFENSHHIHSTSYAQLTTILWLLCSSGLDSGAIAGLIITFLMLLLLGVAGAVVVLLYLAKRRQSVKEKHTTETVRENSPPPIG